MPIYDKPVRALIRDMVKKLELRQDDVVTKERVVEWFAQHYPKVKQSTISAHLIRMSTNARSRVHHRVVPGEDDLFYQIDSGRFRLYQPDRDPSPIYQKSSFQEQGEAESEEGLEGVEQQREFAYEADLKNFLARNLELLEPGLRLYEEEGITGVEFPVGGRFVDILAVDPNNNYVVVELKVSRGYDRVVGQLLRYMAWIAENHAEPPQTVRGFIVAREITEDLRLACSSLAQVRLFEYELSVKLRPVGLRK